MEIADKVIKVTETLEKAIDQEIERLDNLDVNDIHQLRKERLVALKKKEAEKKEWLMNGHGQYSELPDEQAFFDTSKKSKNVICHFYINSSERCKIVDKHLKILAPQHMETKFCYINAERCPFLTKKLNISVMPTIVCIKDRSCIEKIVGFTKLGNTDDFSTATMEWYLGQLQVIDYDLNKSPPAKKKEGPLKKSKIRSNTASDSSDSDY